MSEDKQHYDAAARSVQRSDEDLAIERWNKAHQRRMDAIAALTRQMIPRGNGVLSQESLDELDAAEAELKAAKAETDRILNEIRTGKRR